MSRTGRGKRNVVIFVATVLVLTALVIMALTRRPVTIMPPEPLDMTEKRQSPDNAFYTLDRAAALLPTEKPPALPVPDKEFPQFEVAYEPAPHSIGGLLDIGRPDDDPQLIEYVDRCADAIAKTRQALTEPQYLCPEIHTWWTDRSYPKKHRTLGHALAAYGLRRWDAGGFDADVMGYLLDAVRVGQMVASDGDGSDYYNGARVQWDALDAMSARVSPDITKDMLRLVLREVTALANVPQPLTPHLEFGWRVFDRTATVPPPDLTGRKKSSPLPLRVAAKAVWGWRMKRERQLIIDNRDTYRQACELSYIESLAWLDAQRRAQKRGDSSVMIISSLMNGRVRLDTSYRGAQLVLAIELYRHEHGEYPAGLDALLVPEQLDTLPTDPYTDQPFVYRLADDGYWLYSVGRNRVDDNGDSSGSRDIVIRRPGPERATAVRNTTT